MSIVEAILTAVLVVITFFSMIIAKQMRTTAVRSRIQQHYSCLQSWADECMDILSEALHLCELDPAKTKNPPFFDRRYILMVRLSAVIDRGKWFLPNRQPWEYGQEKEGAYRGIRQDALHHLNHAYIKVRELDYLLKAENDNRGIREAIAKSKRGFTSELQEILGSWEFEHEFERNREIPPPGATT